MRSPEAVKYRSGMLKLRDLRQICTLSSGSSRPSIEPRRSCVLVNMPQMRVLILRTKVYVFALDWTLNHNLALRRATKALQPEELGQSEGISDLLGGSAHLVSSHIPRKADSHQVEPNVQNENGGPYSATIDDVRIPIALARATAADSSRLPWDGKRGDAVSAQAHEPKNSHGGEDNEDDKMFDRGRSLGTPNKPFSFSLCPLRRFFGTHLLLTPEDEHVGMNGLHTGKDVEGGHMLGRGMLGSEGKTEALTPPGNDPSLNTECYVQAQEMDDTRTLLRDLILPDTSTAITNSSLNNSSNNVSFLNTTYKTPLPNVYNMSSNTLAERSPDGYRASLTEGQGTTQSAPKFPHSVSHSNLAYTAISAESSSSPSEDLRLFRPSRFRPRTNSLTQPLLAEPLSIQPLLALRGAEGSKHGGTSCDKSAAGKVEIQSRPSALVPVPSQASFNDGIGERGSGDRGGESNGQANLREQLRLMRWARAEREKCEREMEKEWASYGVRLSLMRKLVKLSSLKDEVPFEFLALEAVLFEAVQTIIEQTGKTCEKIDALTREKTNILASTEKLHQIRDMKRILQQGEDTAAGILSCLQELLANEEDVRRLEISRFYTQPKDWDEPPDSPGAEEAEMLLESYQQDVESILVRVRGLAESLDDTLQIIQVHLATHRNTLLKFEIALQVLSVIVGVVGSIAGVFGMNLPNGFENERDAHMFRNLCFLFTLFLSVSVSAITIVASRVKL